MFDSAKFNSLEEYCHQLRRQLFLHLPKVVIESYTKEVESHLAEAVAANVATGLSETRSIQNATKAFGNPSQVAKIYRKGLLPKSARSATVIKGLIACSYSLIMLWGVTREPNTAELLVVIAAWGIAFILFSIRSLRLSITWMLFATIFCFLIVIQMNKILVVKIGRVSRAEAATVMRSNFALIDVGVRNYIQYLKAGSSLANGGYRLPSYNNIETIADTPVKIAKLSGPYLHLSPSRERSHVCVVPEKLLGKRTTRQAAIQAWARVDTQLNSTPSPLETDLVFKELTNLRRSQSNLHEPKFIPARIVRSMEASFGSRIWVHVRDAWDTTFPGFFLFMLAVDFVFSGLGNLAFKLRLAKAFQKSLVRDSLTAK